MLIVFKKSTSQTSCGTTGCAMCRGKLLAQHLPEMQACFRQVELSPGTTAAYDSMNTIPVDICALGWETCPWTLHNTAMCQYCICSSQAWSWHFSLMCLLEPSSFYFTVPCRNKRATALGAALAGHPLVGADRSSSKRSATVDCNVDSEHKVCLAARSAGGPVSSRSQGTRQMFFGNLRGHQSHHDWQR